MRWKDVNLFFGTLSVVQVLHCLPGGRIAFLEPKTGKGRRSVSLSPDCILSLSAHRRAQEALRIELGSTLSEDDLVFCKPDGSIIKPDTVSHAFKDIIRKAGLDGRIRLHDLRHTHATLMLQQGVHPKVVQERLGHANIAVTLDTYSHVLPGLQEAAARAFDHALTPVSKIEAEKASPAEIH